MDEALTQTPDAATRDFRRISESLAESERRFRLLAETIPSITWTADGDGRITYINDRWFRYTGIVPGESRGHWPVGTIHADDAEGVSAAWVHSVASGTEHRYECRVRRHDGMYRWFEARAVPYRDRNGRVVQWFGATTDIDDRKRAEEMAAFMSRASAELAQLSDYRESLVRIAQMAIPAFADWCGIFLTDEAGVAQRLTLANRDPDKVRFLHQMRDRYPYRPDDPIGPGKVLRTGQSCWSSYMSDEMLAAFSHDAEHLELLKKVNFRSWVCVPIRLQRRIGGAISFVMSDSGRVYNATHLAVAEDLAHRVTIAIENCELVAALRAADEHKSRLLERLQEEHRRKDEFLAVLAHELRNPLAPIRNTVQILRARGGDDPAMQWAREVIDRQVQHMSRLVDDLLDVARVSEGKIELRRTRVPLAAAIQNAVETCRPLIERAGHQVSVAMPVEPLHVHADMTRLAQVFSNLVNNAVKYTDAGGRIWVHVERDGDEAVVRVRDTGVGLAPESLALIFEPFTQVERSLDRAQGGLGIGLTLARRLVELHGGRIEAASPGLGHGSEFTVRLPLHTGAAGDEGAGAADARALDARALRILVVDDNRDAADTLAMVLRGRGHDVAVAYDGLEGANRAVEFLPEVALLDIGLPRLYGLDLARVLRERLGPEALLIAITGLGTDEDRRRSREAGFDHHLTKPVATGELEKLIAARATEVQRQLGA